MSSNYFLKDYATVFKNNASMLFLFTYSKVYGMVSFDELSQMLDIPAQELKERTQLLIDNKQLFAEINETGTELSIVVPSNRHESIIEKCDELKKLADQLQS